MIVQIIIITYYIYNSALTVEIIILSATLANLGSIAILLSVLKDNIRFKGFWANAPFVLNYILKYSLPLIMWGVFLWAQNMIIRWYIEFYMTKEDVANFSVVTSLALLPATAIISIVGQFIVPISYNKEAIQSGTIAAINKKLFGYVSGLMVLGITGAYFLKDYLILLFLDKKYIDVSWSLPLLMIGTSIYAIGQVLIYEIYYYKRPSILIASNIIPGIFSLITGMFFIKLWGYSGAILTNIISFTLSGVITLLTVLYFTRKKAPLLYLTK
jgi:O-antigen/teichoic acid export membrane protein